MSKDYDSMFEVEMFDDDEVMQVHFGQVYTPSASAEDYNVLKNRPSIQGRELIGDQTFIQLGLDVITPQEIDEIFDDFIYGGN